MRTNISTTRGNALFRALLVFVSVFVAQMVNAQTYDNGILKYYINTSTGEARVDGLSSSNQSATSISIPATITYNGTTHPVTGIGFRAFRNNTTLQEVVYNLNALTSIDRDAFDGCTNLSMFATARNTVNTNRILLSEAITSIGQAAFNNCPKIKEVVIRNGNGKKKMAYAFGEPGGITNAIIYGTAPALSFERITTLQTASILNPTYSTELQSFKIEHDAFRYCSNLNSVTIESKITAIDEGAFTGTGLSSINIPATVDTVGVKAFAYCEKLASAVVNSKYIEEEAFKSCTSLSNLTLNNTKYIRSSAFIYTSLTKLDIPEGATSIGDKAFYAPRMGCSLSLVVIPSSLTIYGNSWFADDEKIKMLVVNSNSLTSESNFMEKILGTKHVTKIEVGGVTVGNGWCKDMTELQEVIFDKTSVTIGNDAFSGCTGLTNLNLTASSIGKNAFFGCTGIKNANIVSPTIESFAFAGCTSMQTLTVKASTKLGFGAFSGCSALTSTRITSLPKLSAPCFQSCGGQVLVETTTLGLSTYTYETSPFYGSNFTLATTLCHAKSLFTGCTKLESLYLYNPGSSWVGNIMSDCPNVKTVGVVGSSNDAFRIDESDCLCYISSTKYLLVIPPAKKSIVLKEDGLRYTFPTGGLSQYHGIIDATKLTQVPFFQDSHYDATVLCTPSMEAEFKKYFDADKVIVKGGDGLKGDMNGDGKVTISDVNILVDELLK